MFEIAVYYLAIVAGLQMVTDEGKFPEIAHYDPYFLPLIVFTAYILSCSKGSYFYTLFGTTAAVLCRVAVLKIFPYTFFNTDYFCSAL